MYVEDNKIRKRKEEVSKNKKNMWEVNNRK